MNLPTPPAHLSAESRKLWRHVTSVYELREDELRVLEEAVRALDRAAEARAAIREHGLQLPGRFGLRNNPAVAIENSSALRAAKLFRQLGLEGAELVGHASTLGIA